MTAHVWSGVDARVCHCTQAVYGNTPRETKPLAFPANVLCPPWTPGSPLSLSGGMTNLPTTVKILLKPVHRLKHDAINSSLHQQFLPYKFLFLHVLFKSRNTFNFTLIVRTDLSLNPLKVRVLWIKYNSISIRSDFSHKPLSNKSWRTIIEKQIPARINVPHVI